MNTAVPSHVALILDGNRTWAREKGLPSFAGHTQGAKNIKPITLYAAEIGIKYLTLYTLSTENLKNRSESELKHLFKLFKQLADYTSLFQAHNIKANIIGNIQVLPTEIQTAITNLQTNTQNNTGLVLTFAINYGGRDEITRTLQKLIKINQPITEETITHNLDTKDLPEVDLVIRTGGYQRLSNFLLWQAAYAELFFTETKWPAFETKEFSEILQWFSQQKRKRGK